MRSAGRPYRVLFVTTSSDTGGAESMLFELVRRIDQSCYSPHLLSLRPLGSIARQVATEGLPVSSMQMNERWSLSQLGIGIKNLASQIDRLQIDLVQTLLYRANVIGPLAARLSRRRPITVTSHHSFPPLVGRLPVLSSRLARHFAQSVVTVCEAVREDLLSRENANPEKVTVIPNGLDTERFTRRDAAALRAELGIPPGDLVIGAVGRLTAVKGFDVLLRALATLKGDLDFRLLLAGEGPDKPMLEAMARELGIGDRVHFLGVCLDMADLYSTFDIFVLSSRREAAPYALLEAMACECPVAASIVGGVAEIVEPDISGLLFAAEDHAALSQIVARLGDDTALRRNLGANARLRICQDFEIGSTVKRYEELYRQLLQHRSRF